MTTPSAHRSPTDRVPAPALVLVSILSVQFGSAVARTVFDEAGANGITLMRLAISGLLLTAIVRPAVHRWSRAQLGASPRRSNDSPTDRGPTTAPV